MYNLKIKELIRIIAGYQAVAGLSNKQLANKIKISDETLRRKMKNPLNFTYREILSIFTVLSVPDEERQKVI